MDDLAPDLADYGYVCTIAEGYTEVADERFRRYVGLSRSRVADHRASERNFASYEAWLAELAASLARQSDPVATFSRYASEAPVPDDPEPVHVLLDVNETAFVQQTVAGPLPLTLADTAYDVSGGAFEIVANDTPHEAIVSWNSWKGRYEIHAPSLSGEAYHEHGADGRELVNYINQTQALRVVPSRRRVIYSHGHFYKPIIPLRRAGGFRLLDVLVAVPELDTVVSEKGSAILADDWDARSVFGLISALAPGNTRAAPNAMAEILTAPDLLVCTDMGTEIADFMATEPGRVVLIHAKAASQKRHLSASVLHDVTSQAIKNLPYLQPLSDDEPRSKAWLSPWRAASVQGTATRQRVGRFTSTPAMWKHIREVVSDPQAEREVWLVLGRSLSLAALRSEANRRSERRAPEALQIFALLQATWGAVSQLGARLRVFCSP